MSPWDPHLHLLDSCREQEEANALGQVAIGIAEPEDQTDEQKDGEMFERMGKNS